MNNEGLQGWLSLITCFTKYVCEADIFDYMLHKISAQQVIHEYKTMVKI